MFNSLVVLIASIVMPLLALAGVQAKSLLVLVFGSDFAASTPVFLVLAAANVFAVVELPCDLVLQAVEKVQARLCTQVFAIYNIVAAVLLMRTIGIMGVALATGSAYVATCVMWYLLARHWSGIRIRWGGLLRIAANTAVATSVAYWVGRLGESPLWAVASVVVGLGVYLAMSRVNNFLDEDEKALANRFLRRQVFRV
jgi:O-antigen/teichoic acid export membrane protein